MPTNDRRGAHRADHSRTSATDPSTPFTRTTRPSPRPARPTDPAVPTDPIVTLDAQGRLTALQASLNDALSDAETAREAAEEALDRADDQDYRDRTVSQLRSRINQMRVFEQDLTDIKTETDLVAQDVSSGNRYGITKAMSRIEALEIEADAVFILFMPALRVTQADTQAVNEALDEIPINDRAVPYTRSTAVVSTDVYQTDEQRKKEQRGALIAGGITLLIFWLIGGITQVNWFVMVVLMLAAGFAVFLGVLGLFAYRARRPRQAHGDDDDHHDPYEYREDSAEDLRRARRTEARAREAQARVMHDHTNRSARLR